VLFGYEPRISNGFAKDTGEKEFQEFRTRKIRGFHAFGPPKKRTEVRMLPENSLECHWPHDPQAIPSFVSLRSFC
jgi:hypothetical protein